MVIIREKGGFQAERFGLGRCCCCTGNSQQGRRERRPPLFLQLLLCHPTTNIAPSSPMSPPLFTYILATSNWRSEGLKELRMIMS